MASASSGKKDILKKLRVKFVTLHNAFDDLSQVILGGIRRNKLNRTNKFLRISAVSCGFLRQSAVSSSFCENLRLRNAILLRKNENLQKSAKICEKLRIWLCCPF